MTLATRTMSSAASSRDSPDAANSATREILRH
jgi:hypothetical protein